MSSPVSRQAPGKCQASATSSIPGADWWTTKRVEARLKEALDVMRRLPNPTMGLLRAMGGESWPDSHVKESPENKPPPFDPGVVRPGGAELDEADEAIGWLLWLDDRTRLIVSGRVAGARWRAICRRVGLGRYRTRLIYAHGLIEIARRLNEAENKANSY